MGGERAELEPTWSILFVEFPTLWVDRAAFRTLTRLDPCLALAHSRHDLCLRLLDCRIYGWQDLARRIRLLSVELPTLPIPSARAHPLGFLSALVRIRDVARVLTRSAGASHAAD